MQLVIEVKKRVSNEAFKALGKIELQIVLSDTVIATFVSTPYVRTVEDTCKACEDFLETLRTALFKSGVNSKVTRSEF